MRVFGEFLKKSYYRASRPKIFTFGSDILYVPMNYLHFPSCKKIIDESFMKSKTETVCSVERRSFYYCSYHNITSSAVIHRFPESFLRVLKKDLRSSTRTNLTASSFAPVTNLKMRFTSYEKLQ